MIFESGLHDAVNWGGTAGIKHSSPDIICPGSGAIFILEGLL